MGEEEKEQIAQGYGARISLLERTRRLKISFFSADQGLRAHAPAGKSTAQLSTKSFAKKKQPTRTPLNVADYARVPLLNPDQKVKDWREKLPALENEYDSRMIPIGKIDPGVYLIEARQRRPARLLDRHRHEPDDDRRRRPATARSWSTSSIAKPARRTKASTSKSPTPKKRWRPARPIRRGVFKTEIKPPENTEDDACRGCRSGRIVRQRVSDHGA